MSSSKSGIIQAIKGVSLVKVQNRTYRVSTESLKAPRRTRSESPPRPQSSASTNSDNEADSTIYTEEIITYHHPVNRAFHGSLIGKNGSTLKQLKIATGTRIDITKGKDTVMIKGTQDKVTKAIEAIEDMIQKAYDRARPTHFLSFPLSSPLITRKLGEFQSSVLSSTFQCKGIDPSIMVLSANLHLTLGVFKLLNQAEIEKAVRFLKDTIPGVIDNILQKKLLSVHLKQLATMQTNQADAHVLYVQVHDETQEKVLKDVCTAIIDAMVEEGFMVRDTRPLKLHATLINTSNRASSSGASKDEKRQPFDARPIMKSFSHLDLGVAHLDKLHLMKMGRTGPGKTYVSEGSISLTQ